MLLTPAVWVFHTASNSLTPAGCPITHSSFGNTYTVLAKDPTSERLSHTSWDFPQNSVGKESTCNAGDPGSIPGLERSATEGMGYPFQYSQASLLAHMVKNLPVMRETWVGKIPWRRERLPTPVRLPGESHGQRSLEGYSLWGCKESDTTE